jgi:hypothetical protein
MRRSLIALSLVLTLSPLSLAAKEVYFPIAGSATNIGAFKTDVRLFNPSSSKDITIDAYLLATGNRDNSSVTPRTITVAKRQMKVLNDVVAELGGSELNAIRLVSADDFVATERVYAVQTPSGTCNIAGSLGQDVPPLEVAAAKRNGVLLQLKVTSGNCTQAGVMSFRTNLGVVNPGTTAAKVTFRLYDKENALVAVGEEMTIAPRGVIAPTNLVSGRFFHTPGVDLSEAWVSFQSDQPLLAYASLVDNCSNDPTYISMAEDVASNSTSTKELFFPTAAATTDLRLFNPSSSKDIAVQVFVLPVGNQNNSGVTPRTVNVPRRQMVSVNDAVATLGGSGQNSLRLTSPDDFIASERVYSMRTPTASCNLAGTIGQDVASLHPSTAKKQGVLLQLKNTTGNCSQAGAAAFRSDVGVVNPNGTAAKATFRLYDKNNALIATGSELTIPPLGVIAPTSITSGFFFTSGSADLSEAWVSYTSDQPLLAYASVVDTCTTDPTYIPSAEDTGTGAPTTPTVKAFTVTVRDFAITWSPTPDSLVPGDQVTLTINCTSGSHGFELQDPNGTRVVSIASISAGQTLTRSFTISKDGTFNYFCTNTSCDLGRGGHGDMFGQFTVGVGGEGPTEPRY